MEVYRPQTLAEALEVKSEHHAAVPIAGGTDLMVELNFALKRPREIVDLTRVPELDHHERANGVVRLGAGVTYTRLIADLAAELPGLAIASRTVGSPQIRNRGTVGGNLGTASPAGDTLPVLVAAGASVEVASFLGERTMSVEDFITGVKKNALGADEIITAVLIPGAAGPQQFSKIGTRNAMVIAVASFALVVNTRQRTIGTGIGSAGPRPLRAPEAERFIAGHLEETGAWDRHRPIDDSSAARFGELCAAAASPIDDVRGTAGFRRHALAVMARRTLIWAWSEYLEGNS